MLNILWVEDNFSQEKQDIWFNGRLPDVKTDFVTALKAIHNNLNQYDLVILDIDLENTPHNEKVIAFANYFGKTEKEFLQEGGMFLFLQLIEKGFSRERIIFLTGNADENISRVDELREASEQNDDGLYNEIFAEIQKGLNKDKREELIPFREEDDINGLCNFLEDYYNSLHHQEEKNTYNRFCDSFKKAFVDPPKEINKGLNVTKRLNEWLEGHEKNDYLVLRRGIIKACQYLKDLKIASKYDLLFNNFIEKDEKKIEIPDIHNYLEVLANFLPLHKPKDTANLYKLLLRTLAHEWEAAEPDNIRKQKNQDNKTELFAFSRIMKTSRNWLAHSKIFENLQAQDVAYLFIINMRAMFDLGENLVPYEKHLLSLFDDISVNEMKNNIGDNPNTQRSNSKYQARKIPLIENYALLLKKTGNTWQAINFQDAFNNLQKNKDKNIDAAVFIKGLYQMFWFMTSSGNVSIPDDQKLKTVNTLYYQFKYFDYHKDKQDYIFELARHIYSRSFS